MESTPYEETVLAWRSRLDRALRAEEGWLALAALIWLQEGENVLGSGPECDIRVPEPLAPPRLGTLTLRDGEATLSLARGVEGTFDGDAARTRRMAPDSEGPPTRARVGRLTLAVIRRGERWGLRAWDREHPARTDFPGREWYAVDPAYRVEARFLRFDPPRRIAIANVLGDEDQADSPGAVEFTLGGQPARLVATSGGANGLFLCFRDATSGVTTYGSGRYLETGRPSGDTVVVDFNRAYNPPCAFTPYATCPLPPEGNALAQSVEAGERVRPEAAG